MGCTRHSFCDFCARCATNLGIFLARYVRCSWIVHAKLEMNSGIVVVFSACDALSMVGRVSAREIHSILKYFSRVMCETLRFDFAQWFCCSGFRTTKVNSRASVLLSLEVPQTGLWGALWCCGHDPYLSQHVIAHREQCELLQLIRIGCKRVIYHGDSYSTFFDIHALSGKRC